MASAQMATLPSSFPPDLSHSHSVKISHLPTTTRRDLLLGLFFRRSLSRLRFTSGTPAHASASPPFPETAPPRRRVHFHPRVRVVLGPSRREMASIACSGHRPEARSITARTGAGALWWHRSDYVRFRRAACALVLPSGPTREERAVLDVTYGCSAIARDELRDAWEGEYGEEWWCRYGHSRRGLEHFFRIGEQLANISLCVGAVLEEQARLRGEGSGAVDEIELALVSVHHTKSTREGARRLGLEDADAAAAIQVLPPKRSPPLSPPEGSSGASRDAILNPPPDA